ncbi:MAG: hypothetical protein US66_C0013G0028 [Candidatus Moranbacteria bacterium GW2011_GWD2_37_9]|nr:MAG: hypothetical protein US66_C0013G0028 [Candidatus Moranbacteria bacterium GW2011_GWD2_37_9]KKR02853.1 MAG: hypothetical protein UT31_C0038G0006 [Parcubacteria group bacterium GW2011_GWF2_39_13b]
MSEASVFGNARQIGCRKTLVSGIRYDIPVDATHVLVRPVRRGNQITVVIAFFKAGLPVDYKPQNNTGKYFYRPDGAKQCQVEAYLRPGGWNYDVQWLAGEE